MDVVLNEDAPPGKSSNSSSHSMRITAANCRGSWLRSALILLATPVSRCLRPEISLSGHLNLSAAGEKIIAIVPYWLPACLGCPGETVVNSPILPLLTRRSL